jgi:hypothetical protein
MPLALLIVEKEPVAGELLPLMPSRTQKTSLLLAELLLA